MVKHVVTNNCNVQPKYNDPGKNQCKSSIPAANNTHWSPMAAGPHWAGKQSRLETCNAHVKMTARTFCSKKKNNNSNPTAHQNHKTVSLSSETQSIFLSHHKKTLTWHNLVKIIWFVPFLWLEWSFSAEPRTADLLETYYIKHVRTFSMRYK